MLIRNNQNARPDRQRRSPLLPMKTGDYGAVVANLEIMHREMQDVGRLVDRFRVFTERVDSEDNQLSLQFSRFNISVPTDSDGNNPVFTNAVTEAQITIGDRELSYSEIDSIDDSIYLVQNEQATDVTFTSSKNANGNYEIQITGITADLGSIIVQFHIPVINFTRSLIVFVEKVRDGATGQPGDNAQAILEAFSFRRLATAPATPTGGSFASPTPTTAGWTDGVPAGNLPLYISQRTFTDDGLAPQDPAWSTPEILSQDGADTRLEFSIDGLTLWHVTPAANDEFMRRCTRPNAAEPYVCDGAVRIKGEDGEDAIVIELAREQIILDATVDGAVRTYRGSWLDVRVRRGLNYIEYDNAGTPAANTWQITNLGASPSGITLHNFGNATGTGSFRVYDQQSQQGAFLMRVNNTAGGFSDLTGVLGTSINEPISASALRTLIVDGINAQVDDITALAGTGDTVDLTFANSYWTNKSLGSFIFLASFTVPGEIRDGISQISRGGYSVALNNIPDNIDSGTISFNVVINDTGDIIPRVVPIQKNKTASLFQVQAIPVLIAIPANAMGVALSYADAISRITVIDGDRWQVRDPALTSSSTPPTEINSYRVLIVQDTPVATNIVWNISTDSRITITASPTSTAVVTIKLAGGTGGDITLGTFTPDTIADSIATTRGKINTAINAGSNGTSSLVGAADIIINNDDFFGINIANNADLIVFEQGGSPGAVGWSETYIGATKYAVTDSVDTTGNVSNTIVNILSQQNELRLLEIPVNHEVE